MKNSEGIVKARHTVKKNTEKKTRVQLSYIHTHTRQTEQLSSYTGVSLLILRCTTPVSVSVHGGVKDLERGLPSMLCVSW